ncbi:hypothetical protein Pelo_3653 [Pelomyxa schiedti]|nr:hypothetical protein Pelo_3653 [Pelomyxa schiedti]
MAGGIAQNIAELLQGLLQRVVQNVEFAGQWESYDSPMYTSTGSQQTDPGDQQHQRGTSTPGSVHNSIHHTHNHNHNSGTGRITRSRSRSIASRSSYSRSSVSRSTSGSRSRSLADVVSRAGDSDAEDRDRDVKTPSDDENAAAPKVVASHAKKENDGKGETETGKGKTEGQKATDSKPHKSTPKKPNAAADSGGKHKPSTSDARKDLPKTGKETGKKSTGKHSSAGKQGTTSKKTPASKPGHSQEKPGKDGKKPAKDNDKVSTHKTPAAATSPKKPVVGAKKVTSKQPTGMKSPSKKPTIGTRSPGNKVSSKLPGKTKEPIVPHQAPVRKPIPIKQTKPSTPLTSSKHFAAARITQVKDDTLPKKDFTRPASPQGPPKISQSPSPVVYNPPSAPAEHPIYATPIINQAPSSRQSEYYERVKENHMLMRSTILKKRALSGEKPSSFSMPKPLYHGISAAQARKDTHESRIKVIHDLEIHKQLAQKRSEYANTVRSSLHSTSIIEPRPTHGKKSWSDGKVQKSTFGRASEPTFTAARPRPSTAHATSSMSMSMSMSLTPPTMATRRPRSSPSMSMTRSSYAPSSATGPVFSLTSSSKNDTLASAKEAAKKVLRALSYKEAQWLRPDPALANLERHTTRQCQVTQMYIESIKSKLEQLRQLGNLPPGSDVNNLV